VTITREVSRQEAARELLWRRSEQDFLFFFEHMWRVQIPRKGATNPVARPFQRQVAEILSVSDSSEVPVMLVALKARQIGFTTIVAAYAVWWAIFHNDSPWLMASRNEDAAKKNLARATYGWRRLPQWFKDRCPAVITDSSERLAWANESRIDSIPASAGSGRSDSVFGVLFDEAAHMDNPAELFASLQPLCYGPFIVFSSANGMGNWFHDRWLEAKLSDSAWTPIFCPWTEVDSRDREWYERAKRKFRGQQWLFYQEFPSDDTEAFARSGRVAFGVDLTDGLPICDPEQRFRWSGTGFDVEHPMDPGEEDDLELWVWKPPRVDRDEKGRTVRAPNYVVFCDPAEGLAHGDQTAIAVWDANRLELVATCLTHFPIEELEQVLAWIGHHYHVALMMVERNNQGTGWPSSPRLCRGTAHPGTAG
jgi:ribosomal protein L39E